MYETQINRGIKWLNENKENWLEEIDIDSLKLSDGEMCVLGQTFDDYFNVVGHDLNEEQAVMLGFSAGDSLLLEELGESYDEQSSILTEEWITAIKNERKKIEEKEYSNYDAVFLMKAMRLGTCLATKVDFMRVGTDYDLPTLLHSSLRGKVVKFV